MVLKQCLQREIEGILIKNFKKWQGMQKLKRNTPKLKLICQNECTITNNDKYANTDQNVNIVVSMSNDLVAPEYVMAQV